MAHCQPIRDNSGWSAEHSGCTQCLHDYNAAYIVTTSRHGNQTHLHTEYNTQTKTHTSIVTMHVD